MAQLVQEFTRRRPMEFSDRVDAARIAYREALWATCAEDERLVEGLTEKPRDHVLWHPQIWLYPGR